MAESRIGIGRLVATSMFALAMSGAGVAMAQTGAGDVPGTSVVPATGGSSAAASPSAPASAAPTFARPRVVKHHSAPPEVEPANARLMLVQDAWVYADASKSSAHVQKVYAGKYVMVTGSTRSYLQVKLKSGKVGFIEPSAVRIDNATDKVWRLTRDAEVRDKPNRWAKKLAQVHRGHDVHVVGMALDYCKIRMKDGLEGYIPISSLQ
ncbi:MAG TPA: hypothetical protein VMU16_04460 [Candidatus Binataceae bacterium]|nr:hypothetical protein [Candidatus Binataceae bacterium]